MHGWTLVVLAILALLLGGIALGAYLVAADRLYSRDKEVARQRGKDKANPGEGLATGAARDQPGSHADPEKKP